jgi:carbon-monoxide dehydrogenase large subunit
MLALRANLIADLGAYVWTSTPVPGHTAGVLMVGPYDIPAAAVTMRGKRTNKVPTGPYRGAGRPDATYLLESLIDDAARQLGRDRIELRRRNLIQSFPHQTPLGLSYDSGDFERCLDTALELLGAPSQASGNSALRGTGIAVYAERAAGWFESATVGLGTGGELIVISSASPHGQGHDITFAQIAAERLGVEVDRVILRFGDSEEVPAGTGTFGSRSIPVAGSAIVLALDQLLEQGRRLVAHLLGFALSAVEYRSGRFSAGGREVEWAELARFAHQADRLPPEVEVGLRATARFDSELVFGSGAYGAEVEIDPDTGRLRVLRIVAVDDAGTIVNPLLAHGQVVGGAIQGLGECVIEEVVYDEDGQLRTASFVDYGLVSAAEAPPIQIGEVSSPSPRNPLGAKGIGEGGTIGTLPAVANAVADALGGIRLDPPYTAEKLWRTLNE